MPLPGVNREFLRGLRPADAEAFLRSAGISGDSKTIHNYVQRNCGCHPLVVGAHAGLINRHPWHRGHFDSWLEAPDGGKSLNLGHLDLVGKREHTLDTAIRALLFNCQAHAAALAILRQFFPES